MAAKAVATGDRNSYHYVCKQKAFFMFYHDKKISHHVNSGASQSAGASRGDMKNGSFLTAAMVPKAFKDLFRIKQT